MINTYKRNVQSSKVLNQMKSFDVSKPITSKFSFKSLTGNNNEIIENIEQIENEKVIASEY